MENKEDVFLTGFSAAWPRKSSQLRGVIRASLPILPDVLIDLVGSYCAEPLEWSPEQNESISLQRDYQRLLRIAAMSGTKVRRTVRSYPLLLYYSETASDERGSLMASFSVRVDRLMYYQMIIGVCGATFPYREDGEVVGFGASSWSYSSYGGFKWGEGESQAYGAQFSGGAVIRVEVDYEHRSITFFKDGVSQGVAFEDVDLPEPLFAAVSFLHIHDQVSLIDE